MNRYKLRIAAIAAVLVLVVGTILLVGTGHINRLSMDTYARHAVGALSPASSASAVSSPEGSTDSNRVAQHGPTPAQNTH